MSPKTHLLIYLVIKMITKREILFSIVIVLIMLTIGVCISGNINDAIMEKHQEYNTALQIDSDKELFEYGMRTNVGNAFIYGDLKAIDTVSYEEVPGEYSYIKKVKEKYTMHTRTVTHTRSDGSTYTTTETYWTWDYAGSWDKHATRITFLDVEFDYGKINFPSTSHIGTIKESSHIRYVYYGSPAECIGTLYTQLGDNTISDSSFYNNMTINETIERLESGSEIVVFWIVWIVLTGCIVYGFYYLDNNWLEDKRRYIY